MRTYSVIFDGGCLGNGTTSAHGYGSYRLSTDTGRSFTGRLDFGDGCTNNVAEYKSLLAALEDLLGRITKAGADPKQFALAIQGDSALVINQVSGAWKCKDAKLLPLRGMVSKLLGQFGATELKHVDRSVCVEALGH
jgi:ribonuclease HI